MALATTLATLVLGMSGAAMLTGTLAALASPDPFGAYLIPAILFGTMGSILILAAWGAWRNRTWGWALAGLCAAIGVVFVISSLFRGAHGSPASAWPAIVGSATAIVLAGVLARLLEQRRVATRTSLGGTPPRSAGDTS